MIKRTLFPNSIRASAQTVADDFFDMLDYWKKLALAPDAPAVLVYGGDRLFKRSGITVMPWFAL